jgi:hypothetical protein
LRLFDEICVTNGRRIKAKEYERQGCHSVLNAKRLVVAQGAERGRSVCPDVAMAPQCHRRDHPGVLAAPYKGICLLLTMKIILSGVTFGVVVERPTWLACAAL